MPQLVWRRIYSRNYNDAHPHCTLLWNFHGLHSQSYCELIFPPKISSFQNQFRHDMRRFSLIVWCSCLFSPCQNRNIEPSRLQCRIFSIKLRCLKKFRWLYVISVVFNFSKPTCRNLSLIINTFNFLIYIIIFKNHSLQRPTFIPDTLRVVYNAMCVVSIRTRFRVDVSFEAIFHRGLLTCCGRKLRTLFTPEHVCKSNSLSYWEFRKRVFTLRSFWAVKCKVSQSSVNSLDYALVLL